MEPLLQTQGLCRRFGGVKAVQDFTMQVHTGQVVGVIGPNGAGKTTIFNLISGIVPPTAGEIRFAGVNVTGRPSHEVARLGMSRTFQTIRLFRGLSVLDNVKVACGLDREPYSLLDALALTPRRFRGEAEIHQRALDCLELVGLSHLRDERAENLSYGLQRRLEIARA
ncbi:MAG TPA: ATP-binding cassette domain-containing protein, partial [Symbiobacteriaceae bacterium]|nr:ATP-binding cassette domain-containing protein [Symbiobacteriaceae bacterium]